jgi:hypothetical protein
MLKMIEKSARIVLAGLRAAFVPPLQVARRAALPLRIPYRPEAHYMRGPGPKYRAKWAQAPNCEF